MKPESRFGLYNSNIVSEEFGNEVVIVNLDSGIYFSLRNTAVLVWLRIQNSYSIEEIINDFQLIFEEEKNVIIEKVEKFISDLVENKLILEKTDLALQSITFDANIPKIKFDQPVIEIFSDMQEILLLDPVHDVDQAGWPVVKDENKDQSSN